MFNLRSAWRSLLDRRDVPQRAAGQGLVRRPAPRTPHPGFLWSRQTQNTQATTSCCRVDVGPGKSLAHTVSAAPSGRLKSATLPYNLAQAVVGQNDSVGAAAAAGPPRGADAASHRSLAALHVHSSIPAVQQASCCLAGWLWRNLFWRQWSFAALCRMVGAVHTCSALATFLPTRRHCAGGFPFSAAKQSWFPALWQRCDNAERPGCHGAVRRLPHVAAFHRRAGVPDFERTLLHTTS